MDNKKEEPLLKTVYISGVASCESGIKDNQGEEVSIAGIDDSNLKLINEDHMQGFVHQLGRVTMSKKIFREEDATDEDQRSFFKEYGRKPILYVKGYLYENHPSATAAISIMKNFQKMGTPLEMGVSLEGKVTSRSPEARSRITGAKVHGIALTLRPACNQTGSRIIEESVRKSILNDCSLISPEVYERVDAMLKNMENPIVQNLIKSDNDLINAKSYNGKIHFSNNFNLLKSVTQINDLVKMLSAGYSAGTSAPQNLTGGAALMSQSAPPQAPSMAKSPKSLKKKLTKKDLSNPATKKALLKSIVTKISALHSDLDYATIIEISLEALSQVK
jgi:hypothetical protein